MRLTQADVEAIIIQKNFDLAWLEEHKNIASFRPVTSSWNEDGVVTIKLDYDILSPVKHVVFNRDLEVKF